MQIQEEDLKRAATMVVAAFENSSLPRQVIDDGRSISITATTTSDGIVSMTDGQTGQPIIVSQKAARSSAQTEVIIGYAVAFYVRYQSSYYEIEGRISPFYGRRYEIRFDGSRGYTLKDLSSQQQSLYQIY